MRVAFCHPDLGLGGAERLVVDAALELQSHGYQVEIFAAHHDPQRCFVETCNGELPPVHVHGDWLPRHLFGKGHALFASLRCLLVALAICRCGISFDALFIDQVSTVIPVFKILKPAVRTVFYCHFPDLLLSKKGSWLKKVYRWPLNALEQWTTGMADVILVNSSFTANVFARTFSRLHRQGIRPQVLHPAVQIPSQEVLLDAAASWKQELPQDLVEFLSRSSTATFLSINRFERKKKIDLALRAMQKLMALSSQEQPQLVVAGGYDVRVQENKEHLQELKALSRELGLEEHVRFVTSFTDRQKSLLLSASVAVVYTPPNEHFGIVPLESMSFEKPVVACNSGGPVESIVDGKTGLLAEPTPEGFAFSMNQLLTSPDLKSFGQNGRKHIQENFSRSSFGDKLSCLMIDRVDGKGKPSSRGDD